jgi:hypothetical protein
MLIYETVRTGKRLIGCILTALRDVDLSVVTGAEDSVAEIRSGQRLKVIRVGERGGLECRIIDDVGFRTGDHKRYHARDLTVLVRSRDLRKFKVSRSLGEAVDQGQILVEGVLELLPEIPDRYNNSEFGVQDRENIKKAVEGGFITDTLPSFEDMLDELSKLPPDRRGVIVKAAGPHADAGDVASIYMVHILAPLARVIVRETEGPPVETPPEAEAKQPDQPGVTKDVVRIARDWIKTKRKLDELKTKIAQVSSQSKELEAALLPVVRELEDQKVRIDNCVLALQSRDTPSYKESYQYALSLLEKVSAKLVRKAEKYLQEVTMHSEWLKLEQNRLVQAFNWLTSFSKRAWRWLRDTGSDITELERLVFFSD